MSYEDKMWEAVNGLREDRAKIQQALDDVIKSMDLLSDMIRNHIEKGREIQGAHAVAIAEVKKDMDSIGEKQREHEEAHRWWVSAIIGGAGATVAIFEYIKGLINGKSHG